MCAEDRNEPPDEHSLSTPFEELIVDDEETVDEVYSQLSNELDEIKQCLDALESKTDSLHAELFKLMEETKEIRSEFTQTKPETESPTEEMNSASSSKEQ